MGGQILTIKLYSSALETTHSLQLHVAATEVLSVNFVVPSIFLQSLCRDGRFQTPKS